MPSESALKILIALNSVQMFITLLLVATLASAGLTSQGTASSSDDAMGPNAYGGGGGEPPPFGDNGEPPEDEAFALGGGAGGPQPPGGDDPQAPGGAAASGDPADAVPSGASSAGRTQVVMRTYLNLVSRRLQMAAADAGVEATEYLPSAAEIETAVQSGDATSAAFTAALDKLKPGYEKLGMDFPAPPASRSGGE